MSLSKVQAKGPMAKNKYPNINQASQKCVNILHVLKMVSNCIIFNSIKSCLL